MPRTNFAVKPKSDCWWMRDCNILVFLCLALFLSIIGVRFWMIGKFGSDLPYWDQWDAEGAKLYKGYFDGSITFKDWLAPHNEHRILFSRILSLFLLIVNGQWDARLQMVANAALYALFGCLTFLMYAAGRGSIFRVVWWIIAVIVFCLPYGWENTLGGFQSQFYFLIVFSVVTIWLLGNYSPWSWPWGTGCLTGISCLLTMGSGLMTPLAVLGLLCLVLGRYRRNWLKWLVESCPTIVASGLITVTGFVLIVKVNGHAIYQAHTVHDFMNALALCLAWPGNFFPLWAFANWLPFLCLVGLYVWRILPDGRSERLTIGIGIWLLLQCMATAYARALAPVSSRYTDLLSIGLLVNTLSFYLIAAGRTHSAKTKIALAACFFIWCVMNGIGLYKVSEQAVARDIPSRGSTNLTERWRTSGYLATGDSKFLKEGLKEQTDIPYPSPERLMMILSNSDILAILPVSVREPMGLLSTQGSPVIVDNNNLTPRPPYRWEKAWSLPVPGTGDENKDLSYSAIKKKGLPIIFMFVAGNCRNMFVTDSLNRQHSVISLSSASTSGWQPAYAYCPGPECRISTIIAHRGEPIAFSEPKEMGLLSLCSLVITNNASVSIVTSAILFCCALVITIMKQLAPVNTD